MSKARKIVTTTMYLLHEGRFCVYYPLFRQNSMDFFAATIGIHVALNPTVD